MKVIHRQALCLSTVMALVIPSCAQALVDVDNWAVEGVETARQAGLQPPSLESAAAAEPVTRAEFAAIALEIYQAVTGRTAAMNAPPVFPDCEDTAVSEAALLGLVSGRSDGTFAPDASINRQELCVMLANTARAAGRQVQADGDLSPFPDAEAVDWWALDAVKAMYGAQILSGVSTYGALTLEPFGTASRQQALLLAGRFVQAFPPEEPEREPSKEPSTPAFSVKDQGFTAISGESGEAEAEKRRQIFGETGEVFATQEEAEAAMETIEVPVWQLQENGEKRGTKLSLTVHAALAPAVLEIFQEIYDGDERFPIKNVGGYSWRASDKSEHRWGTAIDINWEENFEAEFGEDGELIATVGSYWLPGQDPYSIPEDGDVVTAFQRHGFTWGGTWNSKRDYMHFSYFGR